MTDPALKASRPLDQFQLNPLQGYAVIDPQDYAEFSRFLSDSSGLVLGQNRQYLVSSRLSRLLGEFGFQQVEDLLKALRSGSNPRLKTRVIDAMTTNETSWFRDGYPFEILRKVIFPELQANKRPVRIWSAACSSGQEAYSISMLVSEWEAASSQNRLNVSIIGTDLSQQIIADAKAGTYDSLAIVRGLNAERRRKFFTDEGDVHKIKPEIQRRVRFQKLNLLDSYAALGKFNVVFCRNVLIYFSADTKRQILDGIAKQLEPGGYLFVGASEAVNSYSKAFESVRTPHGTVFKLRS